MTQDSANGTDWSHGYNVEVGYTYGFGREMAPAWLELCARVSGWSPPPRDTGTRRRYLDLGCGQGMGVCLLAAANPHIDFVGVDFHPEHVEHADGLVAAAGLTNVRFHQADFLDLAADWPAEFGTFDYVALHGITSWVSAEVRAAVVTCLRHATVPGSLVYNSYNTQPGWLNTMPFQHITQRIKATSGQSGRAVIDQSVALFDRLRSGGADTFRILPGLKAQLDAIKTKNTAYLSGEYLSEHWHPFWHSEMATELAQAGLSHVGSATIAENMLPDLLPPPLRDTVRDQADPALREDVQDFIINQSFRRDIFCRGERPERGKLIDALGDVRVFMAEAPAGDTIKVPAAFGEVSLQARAFTELFASLQAGPQTIATLAELPSLRSQGLTNVTQVVLLLLQAGVLAVATAADDYEPAARLNRIIAARAAEGMPYEFFAAPAIGSAIGTGRERLVDLHNWLETGEQPPAALDRWRALGALG